MPRGHHRSGRGFKVETRHPTRRTGRNTHVSALEGPAVHEDYQPFPDELPERDIRADLIINPQIRRAEALFQKPTDAKPRVPMSPRAEAVFRERLAPKGPIVEDDKVKSLQAAQPTPSEPPKRRILPNLLQPTPDPVQARFETIAAERRTRRTITALDTARAEGARRSPSRQGRKLAALERQAQQSLNFEGAQPRTAKAPEPQWPDDAAIAARTETKPTSITSREAAAHATRRATQGQPGAIDVTKRTRVVAKEQPVRRTHQFNALAVKEGLNFVARAYPGNPEVAKHYMRRHEHWKLRRLPPALWNR